MSFQRKYYLCYLGQKNLELQSLLLLWVPLADTTLVTLVLPMPIPESSLARTNLTEMPWPHVLDQPVVLPARIAVGDGEGSGAAAAGT
eukprot:9001925-Ditylum_brightwellii.AAC.1